MLILISGGSCSGKSTLARTFKNSTVLHMDSFYFGLEKMTPPYNFDEPAAFDLEAITQAAETLLKYNKSVKIPTYDMVANQRTGWETKQPAPIIIVEGILSMWHKPLRDLADLKIFLEVPVEERIKRRLTRDVDKGRNIIETLEWSKTVEEMHGKYIEPQKKWADAVINN